MKTLLTMLVLAATPKIEPQRVALPANERVELRQVPRAAFCESLTGSFVRYAELNRYDQIQSALIVSVGVAAIVGEVKAGRAQPYISTKALSSLANVPARTAEDTLIPLAAMVGPALGVRPDANLVMAASELRFLPLAQKGVDVVVFARNVDELTEDRVMKVASAARELGVRVSTVWVGPATRGAAEGDAKMLAWLAAATGGAFVDLSGNGNPCAPRL
jgi:hypothetical protein